MAYALAVTIAAGLLLLTLLAAGALLYQRGGWRGWSIGRWRWHPSALGLSALLLLAGLLLWRLFPAFLFLPIVVPFFWWGRRLRTPRPGPRSDDRAIEGPYRPLDDQ